MQTKEDVGLSVIFKEQYPKNRNTFPRASGECVLFVLFGRHQQLGDNRLIIIFNNRDLLTADLKACLGCLWNRL